MKTPLHPVGEWQAMEPVAAAKETQKKQAGVGKESYSSFSLGNQLVDTSRVRRRIPLGSSTVMPPRSAKVVDGRPVITRTGTSHMGLPPPLGFSATPDIPSRFRQR